MINICPTHSLNIYIYICGESLIDFKIVKFYLWDVSQFI